MWLDGLGARQQAAVTADPLPLVDLESLPGGQAGDHVCNPPPPPLSIPHFDSPVRNPHHLSPEVRRLVQLRHAAA